VNIHIVPAVLGWANPDTGPEQLRLYALDKGDGPRWAKPHARVVETALRENATHYEGDRFLVVHIGKDRFVSPEQLEVAAMAVANALDGLEL
jgi:hypothetical protein